VEAEADAFEKFLGILEADTSSSIVVYEVYKKNAARADHGSRGALLSTHLDSMSGSFLSIFLGRFGGKSELTTNLPMADADYYATARAHQAQLITSDAHFTGLPGRDGSLVQCRCPRWGDPPLQIPGAWR